MGAVRCSTAIVPLLLLITVLAAIPVHATPPVQPSIPINGRYSGLTIKIYIPAYPEWAHDVVLNASIAWNRAQLWYLQNSSAAAAYTFVEADDGTATSLVSFSMPVAFASIAVGWTNYGFAPGSGRRIISTQTYLTPTIFSEAQGGNVTARGYAFWLALHELGRILGLGSVLDGRDIMEPRYTPERISGVPRISTLDLYAVHVLAQGATPNFVTLPDGVEDQAAPATFFLTNPHQVVMAPISGVGRATVHGSQATITIPSRFAYLRFLRPFPI